MIGRRHKGRSNQPNNHSKLTDSNNCTVLLVSNRYCSCYDSLLPVSSAGYPPLWLVVVRRQGAHVKHVAEARASCLRNKDFLASRSRCCCIATQRSGFVLQGFFPAPLESGQAVTKFLIFNQHVIVYISCEYYSTMGLAGLKGCSAALRRCRRATARRPRPRLTRAVPPARGV